MRAQTCSLFGPPGTGKSHLAAGLGLSLVENGFRVLYQRTANLVQKLQAARRDLALEGAVRKLYKYHLLILDDFSYVTSEHAETSVLFELIGARYENRSLLVIANEPFSAWGKIFGGDAMTLAAVDRLVHRSHIFELNVESYRRRAAIAARQTAGGGAGGREARGIAAGIGLTRPRKRFDAGDRRTPLSLENPLPPIAALNGAQTPSKGASTAIGPSNPSESPKPGPKRPGSGQSRYRSGHVTARAGARRRHSAHPARYDPVPVSSLEPADRRRDDRTGDAWIPTPASLGGDPPSTAPSRLATLAAPGRWKTPSPRDARP